MTSANNSELVEQLEGVVSLWANQIRQVLTESEQVRKEADDVGPWAELEHWKRRMVTFNRWATEKRLKSGFKKSLSPDLSLFSFTKCPYNQIVIKHFQNDCEERTTCYLRYTAL